MDKMVSFTQMEKEIQPDFRERVNTAESMKDLESHYSHSMVGMLRRIVGEAVEVRDSDVTFAPAAAELYAIHPRLLAHEQIRHLLDHSDLSNVLGRFAASVRRRYEHLKKHSARTRLKIRN